MSLKNRTSLQYAFQNGRVPTGQDFADLIDSFINQLDDNISMTERKTVQIGNPSFNTSLSVGATWSLLSGKVELTKDSSALKGIGTRFREQLVKGQEIIIASEHYFVSDIADNENLVLNKQATADLKNASARAIPDILAVQDTQQNVLFYISRDGKIGIGKIPQTGLDIHGNMTSDGTIQAVKFSGDGSLLTKIDPHNINGIIPQENLPPININEITGLLTVNNLFTHAIAGTFSGDEGQPMVTGTQDLAPEKLQEGQLVKIGEDVYEISRIINQSLVFKTNLTKKADHVTLYTAGKFIEMNLSGKNVLYINSSGDLYTKGTIEAKSFKGDGSKLTNIPAGEVKGKLALENLPEINVNNINGKLTVNENFSHAVAGTVSGKEAAEGEKNDMLTVSADFPIGQLFAGQQIRVGNYKYEVKEITEDQRIQLDSELKESIKNEKVFIAGNLLELKTDGRSKLLVEPDGNLFVQGKIQAKSFQGDASNLTNITAGEIKGKLSLENLPEINVNDINGKLTVNETFNHSLAGTVSGKQAAEGEKDDLLTVSADFPIGQLFTGQQIKVGNYKYEVKEITAEHEIQLDSELKESIKDEKVFMAGNLLELKTDGRSRLLVEPDGNLLVQGKVDAKNFKGDASNLTNIPAKEINGIISPDNIPPIHISEITGLLTIQGTEDSNFLDLKNHDGNSVANINAKGDLHTDGNINSSGNIEAKSFKGDGSGLTNLPTSGSSNHVQGMLTIDRAFDVSGDATFSGKAGDEKLEINGYFTADMYIGQEVKIGTKRYRVTSMEGSKLGIKPGLAEAISNQKVYTSGNFIEMNLEKANIFNVSYNGDVHTAGTIDARGGFVGNAAGLTNVPANKLTGVFSPDNIPGTVNISQTNGSFTIHGTECKGFLALKDTKGQEVTNINERGDLNTKGAIEAKSFKGDGSGLTNLPAFSTPLKEMLTMDRGFDIASEGLINGTKGSTRFMITGRLPKNIFLNQELKIGNSKYKLKNVQGGSITVDPALTEDIVNQPMYVTSNFVEMNFEKANIFKVSHTGEVYTSGAIEAKEGFTGSASRLFDIPADRIKGVIPAKNLPPQEASASRFTFYADRTVKAEPIEFVTLSWTTNDVDQVELQYIDKGQLIITKSPELALQGSLRTSFYQTTTVTLTVFKEGRIVGQQQITISVLQSPALYMKQLKFEGFPAAYAIEMTVKRFALNVLTDENLKILISALQHVFYPLEECYLHVPQLYRNYGQSWKPEVHGVFMQTLLSIQ